MANPEHLEILKRGVEEWNNWRSQYPNLEPNLREAGLYGECLRLANLCKVDFTGANLRGADLQHAALRAAKLRRTDLISANLRGANFTGANLERADLIDADLRWAIFTRSYLDAANLYGANAYGTEFHATHLRGANLTSALAGETKFIDVDLSVVLGLHAMTHSGPSIIGIETIQKSHGKIPEAFLRGCGVPDEFIAYIRSTVGRPVEFYSCFISYSTKDQGFAERLYNDLQGKGVRCWFAPHDIQGGRKLHEQLDEAIHLHDKLLLILSEASLASEWVRTEISKARRRELQERKRVLFPVRLVPFEVLRDWECFDADAGKDSAREIREYFIPDFSDWKNHDSYQSAFRNLVKDLKQNHATCTTA